jgi:hypothetical protein
MVYDPPGLDRHHSTPSGYTMDLAQCAIAQLSHQHFANEVLHFLLENEPPSKIKYPALSPRAWPKWFGILAGDGNSHVYLDYYYAKSTVWYPFRGYKVVALPTAYRDLGELEGVSILKRHRY